MNNCKMIERLRTAGVSFESGLTDEEFEAIQGYFGFRFPAEIRDFLSCGVPVGDRFFNWRDLSESNLEAFRAFYKYMEADFLFDIESCELQTKLGGAYADIKDPETVKNAILDYVHRSAKLVPFYAHRCFFDGMDGMPIVSFWQPTDAVFYGDDFEDYLECEFFDRDSTGKSIEPLLEKIKETGIWYQLIE